ncbi:MAG TPA: ATP-binding protein [Sedimentisphaerales bacterium]|jgi:two-component system phosphate regulon sensor histidine kinase PhoR|nr:ATP-binding protein [Sedimentisphaerales bacterium]HNU29367.1 ATP-binding protein [Sedimentisphaerales bacterium]
MFRTRLIWQLYPWFLAVTLVAVVAVTASFFREFRMFHRDQARDELKALAGVAASQIARALDAAPAEVDTLCKKFGRAGGDRLRFTVVTSGGRVLGESHDDAAQMKDHSDRPEIQDAFRKGYGESIRPSPTLGRDMLYVAVPVDPNDPSRAVIRVALSVYAMEEMITKTRTHILLAGLVIVVCVALLSLLISRRISQPIVSMRRIAQSFARGRLNVRVPAVGTTELDDLAKALNEMATQLGDRILTITRHRNELETVLSSMIEGVFAVDFRGTVASINKAAAELLGIDPAWAQGRSVEEVVRNAGLQQFVRDTLASDKPTEGDISFPGAGERSFHVQGARLVDARGERAGAVIVLSDMTRIRRLENLRRDFVANVSHELKTPVTSIQGFAEALQEGGLADPEQMRRYVGIIVKHSQRLNAIIDDLLTLSRLEDGSERRVISLEDHNLKDILQGAIELSSVKAEDKRMKVTLVCADEVQLRVNAPLLEQAVVNLIDNAVKYSEPGTTVEVRVDSQRDETAIRVTDHGCGIPAEHLDRIFERFYVVDKSRSRKLGGTGLGLAIVKHIAQVHGGCVTVESTPGKGSTFTLHLPRG